MRVFSPEEQHFRQNLQTAWCQPRFSITLATPAPTGSDCPGSLKKSTSDPTGVRQRSLALENLDRCRSVLSKLDKRVDKLAKSVGSKSCPSLCLYPEPSTSPDMTRTCHGCHGTLDLSHKGYHTGADPVSGCQLPHSDRCEGGILAGKDRSGKLWRGCPFGYVQVVDGCSEDDQYDDDDDLVSGNNFGLVSNTGFGMSEFSGSGLGSSSIPTGSVSTTTQSVASMTSRTTTGASVSVAGSGRDASAASVLTEDDVGSQVAAAHARLAAMKKKKEDLVMLADLKQQEEAMQAETQSLQQKLIQSSSLPSVPPPTFGGPRPKVGDAVSRLKSRNKEQSQIEKSFYGGPNMPQIRKTPGISEVVEEGIDRVRFDVPSLSRRPSAPVQIQQSVPGQAVTGRGSSSHRERNGFPFDPYPINRNQPSGRDYFVNDLLDISDEPRQVLNPRQDSRNCPDLLTDDPLTEPSDEEEDVENCLRLVYRRDENGRKYRSWEPFKSVAEPETTFAWFLDPVTGREYKEAVHNDRHLSRHGATAGKSCKTDRSSRAAHAPGYASQLPARSAAPTPAERVPTFVPLRPADKEGKTEKISSIVEWGRLCPVLWAEKINLDNMNVVVWVWAYLAEILAAVGGTDSDLTNEELQAKLQHLLCVLQVCASHSEKTDFDHQGWKIARLYAKKVQAQLDRGLVSWSDFSVYRGNPHPSELIAAKEELVKVVKKKNAEDPGVQGRGKLLCTTWNSSTVEKKCDWMVKNPDKGKCNRRHDCSYCLDKGLGSFNHQKSFCGKRIAAGDR